jgi:XTP/dITP diphosphohydrolase
MTESASETLATVLDGLVLATGNPHKVGEVRAILQPLGARVRSLADLGGELPEPVEDGATFEENARIKARGYAALTGLPCLAEDSGLEVDALGGAPGVYSARYAGAAGTRDECDRANNEKLLAALAGVPVERRTARFVCAMCLCLPDGRILAETRGTYEGRIADGPRGSNGFGYDPLLYLPDAGRTSAELTPAEKHARSHRGQAMRAMVEALRRLSPDCGRSPRSALRS